MNENVLVFASIIVGVAVSDQLTSLHRLLKRRADVRWDWLLLWVATLALLTLIQIWWTLAGQRQQAPMTIGHFLPMLVLLVLLFLLAAASLPDELAEGPIDLRAYYRNQSRYIWSLYALTLSWLIGTQMAAEAVARGRFSPAENIAELVVIAVMLSMAAVRNRAWHVVGLAVLTYTGPLGWLSRSLG